MTVPSTQDSAPSVPASAALPLVGETPVFRTGLDGCPRVHLQIKLEGANPTGSVKDRAAAFVLKKAIDSGRIDGDSIVIESSSGNFGIALATHCRMAGVPFHCVIDRNIAPENEALLRANCTRIHKINQPDEKGGYLLNRLKLLRELLTANPAFFWVNQYENPDNAEAYYATLGDEICRLTPRPDYIFIGVSSGGTIAGVSRRVKEAFPDATVVAVDTVGSVIFGGRPAPRLIPGIGSSIVPGILSTARIDAVVRITETETLQACHAFVAKHGWPIGGSSGSVLAAIASYFRAHPATRETHVATLFADRGERYASTLYNRTWCERHFPSLDALSFR